MVSPTRRSPRPLRRGPGPYVGGQGVGPGGGRRPCRCPRARPPPRGSDVGSLEELLCQGAVTASGRKGWDEAGAAVASLRCRVHAWTPGPAGSTPRRQSPDAQGGGERSAVAGSPCPRRRKPPPDGGQVVHAGLMPSRLSSVHRIGRKCPHPARLVPRGSRAHARGQLSATPRHPVHPQAPALVVPCLESWVEPVT